MSSNFEVSLDNIMEELSLEALYMPQQPNEIMVTSRDVNRPGLELTG